MANVKWEAITSPGLEPTIVNELKSLGIQSTTNHGKVVFNASKQEGVELTSLLFTPNQMRMGILRGKVKGLGDINRLLSRYDWTTLLRPKTPVEVRVNCRKTPLFRSDIIRTKSERCMRSILGNPNPEYPKQRINLYIEGQTAYLSIDAGGTLLHKRGWRQHQGKAPLRETFAASLLIAAGWEATEPLLDPFCGSGTILIEAGRMALGSSPGHNRRYACWDWKDVIAPSGRRPEKDSLPLFGSDKHPASVANTLENAETAGITLNLRLSDVSDLTPPPTPGLIITNPPYGKRLGQNVKHLYRRFGRVLQSRCENWRVLFLTPNPNWARCVHPGVQKLTQFSNGGEDVGVWIVEKV